MMASTSGGSARNSIKRVTLLIMGDVATLRIGVEFTRPGVSSLGAATLRESSVFLTAALETSTYKRYVPAKDLIPVVMWYRTLGGRVSSRRRTGEYSTAAWALRNVVLVAPVVVVVGKAGEKYSF